MWLTSFSIERINTLPHSLDDIDYIRISFQGLYKTISIIQRNGRDITVSEQKVRYDVTGLLDQISEIEVKSQWISDYSISKKCDHVWHMTLWRGRNRKQIIWNAHYPPNGEKVIELVINTLKLTGLSRITDVFTVNE